MQDQTCGIECLAPTRNRVGEHHPFQGHCLVGSSTVVVHLSNANTGWLGTTEQRVECKENGELIWISGMDMDHESEASQSF